MVKFSFDTCIAICEETVWVFSIVDSLLILNWH